MGKSKLEVDLPAGQQRMLETKEDPEMNLDFKKSIYTKKRLVYISGFLLLCTVVLLIVFILAVTGVIPVGRKNGDKTNILVHQSTFGEENGQAVHKFTLRNKVTKMELDVLSYGATIQSLKVLDKHEKLIDVVLGYEDLKGYTSDDNPYFGALVGRYANRIDDGKFELDGKPYQITLNNNGNALHGGVVGWSKAVWESEVKDGILHLSHISPDGDQGFPGEVVANVSFELTDSNELLVQYKAKSSKPTPINLTTHPYFNLGGEGTDPVLDHNVTIYANEYTPVNSEFRIPTGDISSVDGTVFDLRQSTHLGDVINDVEGGGFDHNFCIGGAPGTKLAAKVNQAHSGIEMTVYTDQPGMQFYTGNFLDVENAKNGHSYPKHSGFCMETQNYPDAPNQDTFPDSILREGSVYEHKVIYKFGLIGSGLAQDTGCRCVNTAVATVRMTACGTGNDTYKEHTYGACWTLTGNTQTCTVGGTPVDVVQVNYGAGREYWIEANDLVSAPLNCSKSTGDCNLMRFVTREEWEARDPVQTTSITPPFSMFMVHHTAGESCNTLEDCIAVVQGIQNFHMDTNGWDDIGYNFLVGEDGRVYEGRGWENRGAHAREHNDYSYGAAILGDFMTRMPEPIAQNQINNLIACGIEQGYITQGHELFGHRDGVCTLCPGDILYADLITWPSYSNREIPVYCETQV